MIDNARRSSRQYSGLFTAMIESFDMGAGTDGKSPLMK